MTGNVPLSSKGKTGEKTVMEYLEDDVDEIHDSDFSNSLQDYSIKYIMGRMMSFHR